MGLIEHCTRSGTAVVLEDDTTVEIIGEKDLEELFQKNPMKMESRIWLSARKMRKVKIRKLMTRKIRRALLP